MANAADNTTLNPGVGGDNITTEDQPAGTQRGAPALPLVDYKMPRSKIIVGTYDVDGGDVTFSNPLPVESMRERRQLESVFLKELEIQRRTLMTRSNERVSVVAFNRGER